MARPPAGTPPVPLKTRMKRYRTELEARGGRRLPSVDLERDGAQALAALLERDGKTIKDTVSDALITALRVRQ